MRRWAVVLALFVVGGCTAPNPDWAGTPGGGGGVGSGGGGAGDGGGGVGSGGASDGGAGVDSSTGSPDLGAPDLAGAMCSADERRCVSGPAASQACEGGHFVESRRCPNGDVSVLDAQCSGGYCAPPVGAAPCDLNGGPSEAYCFNQISSDHSCQPFVDPQSKQVGWACALVVGSGASGDACTDGAQCRSGLCGSNGTCFRPCNTNRGGNSGCPLHQPPLVCKKVTISVEGVTVSADSCVP